MFKEIIYTSISKEIKKAKTASILQPGLTKRMLQKLKISFLSSNCYEKDECITPRADSMPIKKPLLRIYFSVFANWRETHQL